MKILIGGAQFSNKGAQVMLFTVMDQFRKHYGDVEVDYMPIDDYYKYVPGEYRFNTVYSKPPAYSYEDSSPLRRLCIAAKAFARKCLGRKTVPLRDRRTLHDVLERMDAYIDVSGYGLASRWSLNSNRRYLRNIEYAKKHGKKVILLPQSFGPFEYGELQAQMEEEIRRVLPLADLIFAREEDGKRLLEEKYALTNVRLSPDLVLQADEPDWRNITYREPTLRYPTLRTEHNVGIVPNAQVFKRGDREQVLATYAAIIEALLQMGKRVYIFRHSGDLPACQDIYAPFAGREGVTLIEQEFNCWEYSKFVKQFDYIIASRFHAIVHAYKQGVPALMLGWAIKYRELAKLVDQSQYVFDVTQDDRSDAILEALRQLDASWEAESERIQAKLLEMREYSCLDECWKILDTKGCREVPMTMKPGKNIISVQERGLCIACGICAAVCPKGCISMERKGFEVLPRIDASACVDCGICASTCPAGQIDAYEPHEALDRYLLGDFQEILCTQAKNRELLSNSTSGGLVTQLVRALLEGGDYDSAFLVDGYCYDELPSTRRFTAGDDLRATPGSRYLTVSHEKAARYMIAHPDERIIFVATPCATQGLLNAIRIRKLSREQYLFIGLFCDKTMHRGVVEYFAKHPAARGRKLHNLYFRTKQTGGWPGDVRLEFSDGTAENLPRTERMKVKDYFMPERCLYCLDKLNRNCDIAVGDNYIPSNRSELGANSCIIRTDRGAAAWSKYRDLFDFHADDPQDLIRAQHLAKKQRNFDYACLKGLYASPSPKKDVVCAYQDSLQKIETGKNPNCYRAIERDIRRRARRDKIDKATHKLRRVIRKLLR